jgi:hypothetical protein
VGPSKSSLTARNPRRTVLLPPEVDPGVFPKEIVSHRRIKAATEPSFADCHPEAAESRAQASASQRRISVLITEHEGLIRADTDLLRKDRKGGLTLQCDRNDYRGILAGLEGVAGKKAVDSETMTVKN